MLTKDKITEIFCITEIFAKNFHFFLTLVAFTN